MFTFLPTSLAASVELSLTQERDAAMLEVRITRSKSTMGAVALCLVAVLVEAASGYALWRSLPRALSDLNAIISRSFAVSRRSSAAIRLNSLFSERRTLNSPDVNTHGFITVNSKCYGTPD